MSKPYKTGMICGRFQSIHNGHVALINQGLDLCDTLLVFIGSAQRQGTVRNPFTYELRRASLDKIFKDKNNDRLIIKPLYDQASEDKISKGWGRYLYRQTEMILNQGPGVVIYGHDHLQDRDKWFTDEWSEVDELVIKRKFNISSTAMREAILKDNFEEWSKYTPEEIYSMFDVYRPVLLRIYGGV